MYVGYHGRLPKGGGADSGQLVVGG